MINQHSDLFDLYLSAWVGSVNYKSFGARVFGCKNLIDLSMNYKTRYFRIL